MKISCFILLLSIFVFSACNKNDDAPSIDEENTFSCKINGELFVPKDRTGFPVSLNGMINTVSGNSDWDFSLSNENKDVSIYLHGVNSTGEYILGDSDGDGDFFGEEKNLIEVDMNLPFPPSHKSTIASGKINVIVLDLDTKIVLEFDEITLVGVDDPNNVITLTEGKLNINRETLNQ